MKVVRYSTFLIISKVVCSQPQNCSEILQECRVDENSFTEHSPVPAAFSTSSSSSRSIVMEEATNPCSVYLAPSSIPGAGLGMFTAKYVPPGGIILPSDGPSIPIIDPDDSPRGREVFTQLFSEYWWGLNGGAWDPTLYEAHEAVDFQITMGALPNSHVLLSNLHAGSPKLVPYDDSLVNVTDPGAGAFSYYMGRDAVAGRRALEAGEEIFLQYPAHQIEYISEKYGIPTKRDYEHASRLILEFLWTWNDTGPLPPFDWTHAPDKVQSLLPRTPSDMERILNATRGSGHANNDLSFAIAKEMSVVKRSVEWLRENGVCLDTIMPGKSTNTHAGKGAIAQRGVKKGDLIAIAPLLQITDRDVLRIPAFTGDQWQILLNYCFGRDDSSLILCPYTNAILVNHCSSRRPDVHPCGKGREPNAEYRWAKDEKTQEWLKKPIADMNYARGLTLEIVATRDIQAGEEVFIDYGKGWEAAWDRHVDEWEPEFSNEENWKSVKQLNEELEPLVESLWITADHEESVTRPGVFTACYYDYENDNFDNWDSIDEEEHWDDMPLPELIRILGTPAGHDYDVDESDHYVGGSFWPCIVLKRHNKTSNVPVEEDLYTVRIIQSHLFETTDWKEYGIPRIITHYPRKSIRHFYLPYESDLHIPNAFRHHIEFKDELFPSLWKDRRAFR